MEALGCLAAVFGIPILISIFRALFGGDQKSTIKKEIDKGLTIKCVEDTIKTESGERVEVYKLSMSGTCAVPSENYPCKIVVIAVDSTDEAVDGSLPIISMIPDMANEDGILMFDFDMQMPYTYTSFEDSPIGILIPSAMLFPKKGRRKLKITVGITSTYDTDQAFQLGQVVFIHNQKSYGYMERAERDLETDKMIAELAVAMCAADGIIDKRETAVVRRFFEQRMISRDHDAGHKEEISQVLENTLSALRSQPLDSDERMHFVIRRIVALEDPSLCQEAYELCVQVVAADQQVLEEEIDALEKIARELQVSDTLAREIRDRFFTVSMFEKQCEDALIDMPAGLSKEDQITFLNREYQKWRSRVTHQDASIRTEAELRLQHITKLRRELSDGK